MKKLVIILALILGSICLFIGFNWLAIHFSLKKQEPRKVQVEKAK